MPQAPDNSNRFDPPAEMPDSSGAAEHARGGWLWAATLVLAMLASVTLTARPLHGQAASQAPGSQRCTNGACPMGST